MTQDPLSRAGVSAALAKLTEAERQMRGLLAPAAEGGQASAEGERPIVEYVQHRTLQEMRQQGFKTNDLVEIPPFSPAEGSVVINGIPIRLKAIESLMLHALVEHALAAQKGELCQPWFLSVPEIIISMERTRERSRIAAGSDLAKVDVYKAVDKLREKLSDALLNPNLIEGKRGQGYRLSTPWWNLIVPAKPLAAAVPSRP